MMVYLYADWQCVYTFTVIITVRVSHVRPGSQFTCKVCVLLQFFCMTLNAIQRPLLTRCCSALIKLPVILS